MINTALHALDDVTYHADPCETPALNASTAKLFVQQSPAHAFASHPRLGGKPSPATEATDGGKLLEKLLLGTGPDIGIVYHDNFKRKVAKEEAIALRAEGKIPILRHKYESLLEGVEQAQAQLLEHGIHFTGESSVAAFWGERAASTGEEVQCRGLLDHYIETDDRATIWDLKRIHSCHPDAIEKRVEDLCYGVQAAAYVRGVTANRPHLAGRVRLRWLFLTPEPPVQIMPAQPDAMALALGDKRWQYAVDQWATCMRTKHWPGFVEPGQVLSVGVPRWVAVREGMM